MNKNEKTTHIEIEHIDFNGQIVFGLSHYKRARLAFMDAVRPDGKTVQMFDNGYISRASYYMPSLHESQLTKSRIKRFAEQHGVPIPENFKQALRLDTLS